MSLKSYNTDGLQLKGRETKEKNIIYNNFVCKIIIPPNLDIICFPNFFSRPILSFPFLIVYNMICYECCCWKKFKYAYIFPKKMNAQLSFHLQLFLSLCNNEMCIIVHSYKWFLSCACIKMCVDFSFYLRLFLFLCNSEMCMIVHGYK